MLNFQVGLKTKPKKLNKNKAINIISKLKFGMVMLSKNGIIGNNRSENQIFGDTNIGMRNAKKAKSLTQKK